MIGDASQKAITAESGTPPFGSHTLGVTRINRGHFDVSVVSVTHWL